MYKELEVDRDLYHLLNVLLDLDNYHFDKDITKLLIQLKDLVDNKLWSNLNNDDCCIISEKIVVKILPSCKK